MAVRVHVVAGFLGAGKTSVMQHLLAAMSGERVGIVVNDFGTAGIDQVLLGGGAVRSIRGSCVCCTAPEGLVGALSELIGSCDRVFVEPTGLARPADVIDTVRRAPFAADVVLGPLIVVVDPTALAAGHVPAAWLAQAGAADVLVANRLDRASAAELSAFRDWAAALWPGPHAVHETQFGAVPATALAWPKDARAARPAAVASGASGGHEFVVRSWSWPADVVFHRGRLLAALSALSAVRLKGLLRTEEGTVLIQRAGDQTIETASGRRSDSRLDVIVAAGSDDPFVGVDAALAAARRTAAEAESRGTALEVALPGGATTVVDRDGLAALPGGVDDVSRLIPGRSGAAARVASLLLAAGAPTSGCAVVVAADGFVTEPVPLAALAEAVLLYADAAGAPLAGGKGGPFRLLIPGDSGPGGPCANVKAVVRIAIRATPPG